LDTGLGRTVIGTVPMTELAQHPLYRWGIRVAGYPGRANVNHDRPLDHTSMPRGGLKNKPREALRRLGSRARRRARGVRGRLRSKLASPVGVNKARKADAATHPHPSQPALADTLSRLRAALRETRLPGWVWVAAGSHFLLPLTGQYRAKRGEHLDSGVRGSATSWRMWPIRRSAGLVALMHMGTETMSQTIRRKLRAGQHLCLAGILAGTLVLAWGCGPRTGRMDPDSEDDALIGAIGSKDFRSVCYQMAQSLVRIPQIQNAANPPTIAFTSVVNASDELFSTDDFLYKMRTELVKHTGGKMVFLDRDVLTEIQAEERAKQRGKVTRSDSKPLYGADFFLAGRVESIRRTRGRHETMYMRLSFRLTDAASSAIVWEDDYEVKKYRQAGVYDR
jgi:PBP1b-binding outer membrane lipoprotein LpoB